MQWGYFTFRIIQDLTRNQCFPETTHVKTQGRFFSWLETSKRKPGHDRTTRFVFDLTQVGVTSAPITIPTRAYLTWTEVYRSSSVCFRYKTRVVCDFRLWQICGSVTYMIVKSHYIICDLDSGRNTTTPKS